LRKDDRRLDFSDDSMKMADRHLKTAEARMQNAVQKNTFAVAPKVICSPVN
jgi:hypothetical protein